jgi:site-specific DNA-methyltransferase (adenine-specific)
MNDNTKKIMFSSDKDTWETPSEFWNELNQKYDFQFDLAASKQNTKCHNYFDEEINSLEQDWHKINGWLWLNPPFRQSKEFTRKCDEEAQKGAKILMLMPSRTDTKAFHNHINGKYDIIFLKGRLKFELGGKSVLSKNGKPQSAPFPSILIEFKK